MRGRKERFPSSLLPRARSRALIPFPFPFERLPRGLGIAQQKPLPTGKYRYPHSVFLSLYSLFSLTGMKTIEIIEYQPLFEST